MRRINTKNNDIICIGSALWDIIGISSQNMHLGADVPGRIQRQLGGVALNVATALSAFGHRTSLLSAIGKDALGDALIKALEPYGIDTSHIVRQPDLPTDTYMAIESPEGLIAAIADAHSLEAAGAKFLTPFENGALGSLEHPYSGLVVLDGNLTQKTLQDIAQSPLFQHADLRIVPASPGKVTRLNPLLLLSNTCFYLNLEEANIISGQDTSSSQQAVEALLSQGVQHVIVTNGAKAATEGYHGHMYSAAPPDVVSKRVTGAGDTFIAAHISAGHDETPRQKALDYAVKCAARFVSGYSPVGESDED